MSWLLEYMRDKPVFSVNKTVLTVNPVLGKILQNWPFIRIEIQDGHPVIYPDPDGRAVVKEPGRTSGFIAAPKLIAEVQAKLPVGSRWVMVWAPDGRSLRGVEPQAPVPEAPPDKLVMIRHDELAELRRLAEIGRRVEQAG